MLGIFSQKLSLKNLSTKAVERDGKWAIRRLSLFGWRYASHYGLTHFTKKIFWWKDDGDLLERYCFVFETENDAIEAWNTWVEQK